MKNERIESFAMAMEIAQNFFGITLPTTVEELKSAFRREARILHPDVNKNNTSEAFNLMNQAHESLIKASEIFPIFAQVTNWNGYGSHETIDGIPLSQLGKGIGEAKNGVPCDHCSGKGYSSQQQFGYEWCSDCTGTGSIRKTKKIACTLCDNGKFTQRLGKVVDCYRCKGTGIFREVTYRETCLRCGGRGRYFGETGRILHAACRICDGTGEVNLFNPVFSRGRLTGASK